MDRLWIALGAFSGLTGVAMAAAAAHALPARLDASAMHSVDSAVQMQGWHAAALVLVGVLSARSGGGVMWAMTGAAFTLGLLLFSGGIYAQVIGGLRLGPVAPVGGTLLMAGWLLLGISAAVRA